MPPLPSPAKKDEIISKLKDLCQAIESHPQFPPALRSASAGGPPGTWDGNGPVPAAANPAAPVLVPGLPRPPAPLFCVWDFVRRSHYAMRELDNVREGKEVRFPEQIAQAAIGDTNEQKALALYSDVCGRVPMIHMLLTNPMTMQMMTGLDQFDYGDAIIAKSQIAVDSLN